MQVDSIAESYVARFDVTVARLCRSIDTRLLLAVSGGPDSLALMLLANAAMPGRIACATVDHGLRPEGADEAEYVASLCAARKIPHRVLRPPTPLTGNILSAARVARYRLLKQAADDADCTHIVTGHHADDQLETLLMRLSKGSGVDGMSGIRLQNGRIIRPLLGFKKSELEQVCADAEVEPVRDPSNDNVDFDRVAVRQWLSQLSHPLDALRAARTAAALADAGAALDWMAQQLASVRITQTSGVIECDGRDLPRELQRRLVLRALAMADPDLRPRGAALDRLIENLSKGRTSTVGNILCRGGDVWQFTPGPPRQNV